MSAYYSNYSPYGFGGGYHNPYLYSPHAYPGYGMNYYNNYGGYGNGNGYYPWYNSYYGSPYRSPNMFRNFFNRLRYGNSGSYYGNYSPHLLHDYHYRRGWPSETNYVSSVKDLWKSNDIY